MLGPGDQPRVTRSDGKQLSRGASAAVDIAVIRPEGEGPDQEQIRSGSPTPQVALLECAEELGPFEEARHLVETVAGESGDHVEPAPD